MKKIFDKIIIGSGPSSLGYLLGINKVSKNNLLITNDAKKIDNLNKSKFHPKLYYKKKLLINPKSKVFGETNSKGGLSLAWGGGLSIPNLKDIRKYTKYNKKPNFLYNAYYKILENFYKYFKIYNLKNFNFDTINLYQVKNKNFINFNSPNFYQISNNNKFAWSSFKFNLFPLIKTRCKKLLFEIKTDNVTSVKKSDNIWIVNCNNNFYYTKKIILAGGAISNRKLLIDLDEKFKKINLCDYPPNKIFAVRFFNLNKVNLIKNLSIAISGHFVRENLLYSVYSVDKLSYNFLKKNVFLGHIILALPKFIKKKLFFIQVWEKNNNISLFKPCAKLIKINYFRNLLNLIKFGFFPFFIKRTSNGEGFHYLTNTKQNIINKILKKYNNINVLGGFGNYFSFYEHPTLTFMADAYLQAKSSQKSCKQ
jgi:hypothetical protein